MMSGAAKGAMGAMGRRGLMLVLSSPSGAGKTTLCREILVRDPGLAMSVSVTTRQPRPGEADGVDYHFRTVAELEALRDSGGLLEWASVHGNLYGTPRANVMERLVGGGDVLFDIDWQGARQLAVAAPEDTVRVFVLPPSAAALEQRLLARRQDGADVIARRLAGAAAEIARCSEYDYVIVNEKVETSLVTLQAILAAERVRRPRLPGLGRFTETLIADLAVRVGGAG
jgi:guanylate kinase